MRALSVAELEAAMRDLPGWAVEDAALARSFEFPTYADGVAFALKVALLAERGDHHPDLLIGLSLIHI